MRGRKVAPGLDGRCRMGRCPLAVTPHLWSLVLAKLRLSPRESAVAALYLDSASIEQIGESLTMSPHTVRSHLRRIYSKAGVSNRFDLLLQVVMIAYHD